jgi:hypothetical protein
MTQKENLSGQIPSEALASGTDTISKAQEDLGTEGTQTEVTFTKEEVGALIKEAVSPLQAEVRGLQGVADRTAKTVTEMTEMARNQTTAAEIETLPEEMKPWARRQEQLRQEDRRLYLEALDRQAAVPTVPALDEPTAALVREYGLESTDPRLDYAAYRERSVGGTKRFLDSVQRAASNQVPQRTPVTNTKTEATPPSPDAAPQRSGTNLTNEDGLREAFITGKITISEFQEKAARLGVAV